MTHRNSQTLKYFGRVKVKEEKEKEFEPSDIPHRAMTIL